MRVSMIRECVCVRCVCVVSVCDKSVRIYVCSEHRSSELKPHLP